MNLNKTLSKHIFCPLSQLKPVTHQVLLAPCLYLLVFATSALLYFYTVNCDARKGTIIIIYKVSNFQLWVIRILSCSGHLTISKIRNCMFCPTSCLLRKPPFLRPVPAHRKWTSSLFKADASNAFNKLKLGCAPPQHFSSRFI